MIVEILTVISILFLAFRKKKILLASENKTRVTHRETREFRMILLPEYLLCN